MVEQGYNSLEIHEGVRPYGALNVMSNILKSLLHFMGSQRRCRSGCDVGTMAGLGRRGLLGRDEGRWCYSKRDLKI